MHPQFRLFCTQNPNTGMFKGKREKLSASFLDRFCGVVFEPLSTVGLASRPWRPLTPEIRRSGASWWPNA